MPKKIPYTLTNFKDIVTEGYYYVDKTMYLPELEKYKHPVFLRPRRFGKSLFTEMLRYYYDIKYKESFDKIFGNLWIGKNPTPNRNKYFFLRLRFSGMGAWSENEPNFVERQFNDYIRTAVYDFFTYYSKELDISHNEIQTIDNKSLGASSLLSHIASLVKRAKGKIYVAIDEYDSLTNAMAIYYKDDRDEANPYLNILTKGGFFRAFFEVLKDESNSVIERVYLTGILPITIADMNSGYNIAEWLTFNKSLANMHGITEKEFDNLLNEIFNDYQLNISKQEVKNIITRYYNNYKFTTESKTEYNPSMTMYALQSVVNTGQLPQKLLDSNIRIDYNQISYIFGNNQKQRDEIVQDITENKQMFFNSDLAVSFDMNAYRDGKYITEGLFYSGILTQTNDSFTLKIPNIVTYDMTISYFERIKNFSSTSYEKGKWLKLYIQKGDAKTMIAQYFENVIKNFPGQFFANTNKSFYHGLLFHLLFSSLPKNLYEILPEYNMPQGRADIMCRSLPKVNVHTPIKDIFEIKQVAKSTSDSEFIKKFIEAKNQLSKYLEKEWRGVAVCFRGNKDYLVEYIYKK